MFRLLYSREHTMKSRRPVTVYIVPRVLQSFHIPYCRFPPSAMNGYTPNLYISIENSTICRKESYICQPTNNRRPYTCCRRRRPSYPRVCDIPSTLLPSTHLLRQPTSLLPKCQKLPPLPRSLPRSPSAEHCYLPSYNKTKVTPFAAV